MPGVACDNIITSKIDKEDLEYLHKGFISLLIENKQRNTDSCYSTDSFSCKPFEKNDDCIQLRDKSCWSKNGKFDRESPDDSDCDKCDFKSLYNDILENGVDEEDLRFLKKSFNNLLWDTNERHWTSKVCWDYHPTTAVAKPVTNNKARGYCPENKSGCARSEGYFKVDKLSVLKVKNTHGYTGSSERSKSFITPYSKCYKGNKQNLSRDARNDQRRLSTAYQTITDSDLLKLNELKFRKKKLRLGKSEIHGLGLFAMEPIAPNEIIIEYVGQIIRPIIADMREKEYKSSGIGSYCFKIDDETIIDATKHGNLNRYINHSCNPNSYAKILNINSQNKIVIYSKKTIKIDDEITYDYKMPFEDDKIICLCRASGCRKFIN